MGGCIRRSGKVQSPRDMPAAGALLCFSEAESGGFLLGNKAGGASTATGFGYELEDIAACTIGGVSTNGGVGKVSGCLLYTSARGGRCKRLGHKNARPHFVHWEYARPACARGRLSRAKQRSAAAAAIHSFRSFFTV